MGLIWNLLDYYELASICFAGWNQSACIQSQCVCATKMSFLSEWTVQYKWDERVCQSLCVRHGQQHVVCVSVCVCVCLCESDLQQRKKKHPKKQQRWWSHFVMFWWGNFNTNWLKYLPNILREDTSAKVTHQSISHFVINIIYFFNIIQHLIQIPYSWEDGWMDGTP